MHMTEDNPHRPATGTHTNGISSEKLEDGELEDEPKCAQEHPNGDTAGSFCVRRQQLLVSYGNAHV